MKNKINELTVQVFGIIALVAVFTLSAASCYGQTINSVDALKTYLDNQPANGPDKPIKVTMSANVPMLPKIAEAINSAGKYVSLNLSGNALTEIPSKAFQNCETLASITIPNSVTSIGGSAFRKCINLASVTIPNSVTNIWINAFDGCVSLNNLTIPNSVTSIDGTMVVQVNNVTIVDPSLNGKLIYASAKADPNDILSDDLFGVSEKAIALIRLVEYYQYEEHSKTEKMYILDGSEETTTTYTYEKKWVTSPVNSAGFADPERKKSNIVLENDVKSGLLYAKKISFGEYKLPAFIIEEIKGSVPSIPVKAHISDSELAAWNNRIAQRAKSVGYKTGSNATLAYVLQDNVIYFGTPSSPQIGDVRITLAKVPPTDISIIARVVGSTFERYFDPTGRTFTSVAIGRTSMNTMIKTMITE